MKNLAALLLIILFFGTSCSKQGETTLPKEEQLESADTDNNSIAGKLDSLLMGSWVLLGEAVDYTSHIFPADPLNPVSLTFDNQLKFIEKTNNTITDSGTYRVVDTTYSTSNISRCVQFKREVNTSNRRLDWYYLSFRKDTLTLSYLLGGSIYKRVKK